MTTNDDSFFETLKNLGDLKLASAKSIALKRLLGLKDSDELPELSNLEFQLLTNHPEYKTLVDSLNSFDTINSYIRTKMREESVLRRILPPMAVTGVELPCNLDDPVKIVDNS